jgi:hypothetical protein
MIVFIVLTIYCIAWNIVNAWFNKKFIEGEDFHLAQSIQISIMALGVSTALFLKVDNPLVIVYGAILILAWRFTAFDFILNAFRGKPWDYKLWGNAFLKFFVFVTANCLFIFKIYL